MSLLPSESEHALALRSDRAAFVQACPFYFLVGVAAPAAARQPGRTGPHEAITDESDDDPSSQFDEEQTVARRPRAGPGEMRPLFLAVKKVQPVFESMITIGRTPNNDIVINDPQISRFHAFLRVHPDRVDVGDPGSRNGTFVNDTQLVPKGAVHIVNPGDVIKFGGLALDFLDAGGAWERVRTPR